MERGGGGGWRRLGVETIDLNLTHTHMHTDTHTHIYTLQQTQQYCEIWECLSPFPHYSHHLKALSLCNQSCLVV